MTGTVPASASIPTVVVPDEKADIQLQAGSNIELLTLAETVFNNRDNYGEIDKTAKKISELIIQHPDVAIITKKIPSTTRYASLEHQGNEEVSALDFLAAAHNCSKEPVKTACKALIKAIKNTLISHHPSEAATWLVRKVPHIISLEVTFEQRLLTNDDYNQIIISRARYFAAYLECGEVLESKQHKTCRLFCSILIRYLSQSIRS